MYSFITFPSTVFIDFKITIINKSSINLFYLNLPVQLYTLRKKMVPKGFFGCPGKTLLDSM
jgi:hypothetical protein